MLIYIVLKDVWHDDRFPTTYIYGATQTKEDAEKMVLQCDSEPLFQIIMKEGKEERKNLNTYHKARIEETDLT